MPGIIVDGVVDNEATNELNSQHDKENSSLPKSPGIPLCGVEIFFFFF